MYWKKKKLVPPTLGHRFLIILMIDKNSRTFPSVKIISFHFIRWYTARPQTHTQGGIHLYWQMMYPIGFASMGIVSDFSSKKMKDNSQYIIIRKPIYCWKSILNRQTSGFRVFRSSTVNYHFRGHFYKTVGHLPGLCHNCKNIKCINKNCPSFAVCM